MQEILIECSPGVSGDMLLAAFYDLGVPEDLLRKSFNELGLKKLYDLKFKESKSCSIRGINVEVEKIDQTSKRDWQSIRSLILNSSLNKNLQQLIYKVFESLAYAESTVHGIKPEDVHFHEIGAIDSLIDIVGVCTAFNYLKPKKVYCNEPMLGQGFVQTDHGKLSIPSPAVIELIRKKRISVRSSFDSIEGELSTPTGIALLCNLVDYFNVPLKYSVEAYGVGIGNSKFPFPNLVRVSKINAFTKSSIEKQLNPKSEEICFQEAWIDDQTPEDIANFVQNFRDKGAYDVSYKAINMKKDRVGFSIQAIVPVEKKDYFRDLWFHCSNTIGVRERLQSRWILLRRSGTCSTNLGKIKVKQTLKPDGSIATKPENDEILRLKKEHNISIEEIRNIVRESSTNFIPSEDWK